MNKFTFMRRITIPIVFTIAMVSLSSISWGETVNAPSAFPGDSRSREHKTWTGHAIAITVGTVGGLSLYSLASGDWRWAYTLWDVGAAGARFAWTGTSRAAGYVASASQSAIIGSSGGNVAARATATGAATRAGATGAARAAVASSRIWPTLVWAGRWVLITASGVAGALLGNSIYSAGQ